MRALAVGTLVASLPSFHVDEAEARKKRKKSRRKKKQKNQQPSPQVRADATCPGPETNGFPLQPQGVLAQSYTAGQTGVLVRADLRLAHSETFSATGNLFLRLAPLVDAFPGPNALASAQVAASSVAFGASVITFTFADPAPVKAGKSYALVLSRDGEGSISWTTRDGTTCDGRSFFSADSAEPLEPKNDFDFIFTTFVQS
jgi:hypothetical protein